jgi:hypothetical protein
MFDFLRKMGKSKHEWVEESLSAYLDGELSTQEKASVEEHLEKCRACRDSLSTLRQTVALLRELPAVSAPRSFALRPAVVEPKVRGTAPSWGYGLLKGATALAALLLILLIGGEVTWRFLGGFPMGAAAPVPPSEERALPPSAMPTEIYAPTPEEPLIGEGRDGEAEAETLAPLAAEEPPAPAPTPSEPTGDYWAPPAQEVTSPEPTVERTAPACTPTAPATPGPRTNEQEMAAGAAEIEGTVTPAETPSPAGTAGAEEAEPTPEPQVTGVPEAAKREPASAPTPTSEVVAKLPAGEPTEFQVTYGEAANLPLSPIRLAELILFVLLTILVPATVITGWWIRRAR